MNRLLLVVLGLWLGLLLASWVIATVNFRSVDRVLGPELRHELDQRLAGVSPADRRAVLGRSLDFLPRPLPPAIARRFGMLHAAYVGGDVAKATSLIAAVVRLIRRAG